MLGDIGDEISPTGEIGYMCYQARRNVSLLSQLDEEVRDAILGKSGRSSLSESASPTPRSDAGMSPCQLASELGDLL